MLATVQAARYAKQTTKTKYVPPCHQGNVFVFKAEVDGITIRFWGGGDRRGAEPRLGWVVIDLAQNFHNPIMQLYGLDGPRLANWLMPYAVISLPIRDFAVPYLPADFWVDLLLDLADFGRKREEPLDVLVACDGGHGRTGMVLSILAVLTGATDGDPVAFVRQHYCEKAVETYEQIDYIKEITGVGVTEAPGVGVASYPGAVTQWYTPDEWAQRERLEDGHEPTDPAGSLAQQIEDLTNEEAEQYLEEHYQQAWDYVPESTEDFERHEDDWHKLF